MFTYFKQNSIIAQQTASIVAQKVSHHNDIMIGIMDTTSTLHIV